MKVRFKRTLCFALMLSILMSALTGLGVKAEQEAGMRLFTYGDENGAKEEAEIFDGENMVDWTRSRISGDEANPMFEPYRQVYEDETIWTLRRQRDSAYKNNADGYVTYSAADMTSFEISLIIGNYQGKIPSNASFFTSADGSRFTQHSVFVKKGVDPSENGEFQRWTYIGTDIPDGTNYLRIQMPGLPDASEAGFSTVQLEKVKINKNAEIKGWADNAAVNLNFGSNNVVSVSWSEFESNEDVMYLVSHDNGIYINTVNTTVCNMPIEEHTEYRFEVIAIADGGDTAPSLISSMIKSDIEKSSGSRSVFIDKFKFAETITSGKTWNGGTPAWNADTNSVQRSVQTDNLEVVYEIPNGITGFEVTMLAYNPKSMPGDTTFEVRTADGWQSVAATKLDELGSPNYTTVPWIFTAENVPEGAEALKIIFGKASSGNNRQNTVQLNQVKVYLAEAYESAEFAEKYNSNTGADWKRYMADYENTADNDNPNNIDGSDIYALLRQNAGSPVSYTYSVGSINEASGKSYVDMTSFAFDFVVNKSYGAVEDASINYSLDGVTYIPAEANAELTNQIYSADGSKVNYDVYTLSGALPEGTAYIRIDIAPSSKTAKVYSNCYGGGKIGMRAAKTAYAYTWSGRLSADKTDTSITLQMPEITGNPQDIKYIITKDNETIETTDSEYMFENLVPGREYAFSVVAQNIGDSSQKSEKLNLVAAPYAQEDLWGSARISYDDGGEKGDIILNIPAIPGAEEVVYTIKDAKGDVVAATSSTEFAFSGLSDGNHDYSVQAVAVKADGIHYSTWLYTTVTVGDVEKWSSDAKIDVYNIAKDSFSIAWTAFENMENREYAVRINGVEVTKTTDTFCTITGLDSGTVYGVSIIVVEDAQSVSDALSAQAETSRDREFFVNFMGSDLSNSDWTKNTYYHSAEEVPYVAELNDASFSLAQNANDPEGPVWGAFFRVKDGSDPGSYIVVDPGNPLTSITVRTLVTGADADIKIEYALDDGEPQYTLGNFDSSDYEWISLEGSYSAVQTGTMGEWDDSKKVRKTDRQVYEHTISKLPANARYFKIYFSKITAYTGTALRPWRSGTLGFGGTYADAMNDSVNNFDFTATLAEGDSMTSVTKDLALPDSIDGYPVTWSSSVPDVIGADGKFNSENIKTGYTLAGVTITADVRRSELDTEPELSRSWTLTAVKNTDGWSAEDYLDFDLSIYPDSASITAPQSPDAVYTGITLPAGIEGGSTFSWSVSDTEHASVSGNNVNVTLEKDREVTLNLIMTASKDGITKSREYPITLVRGWGNNIAWGGATATASTNRGSAANAASKDPLTYWESAADDTAAYIQYTFAATHDITGILLAQIGDSIDGFVISVSKDGKNFTDLYSGGALADSQKILIPVEASDVKAIKASFTAEEGKSVKISSFEVYDEPVTENQIFDAVFGAINLPKRTTANLTLPTTGYNGMAITWTSSNTSVISNTGVIGNVTNATAVTLTASVTYNGETRTKAYSLTVAKNSIGSTSSGFGGSSGGSSGISMPYVPPVTGNVTEPAVQGIYADVTASHWAYSYIKDLTDKNIVSGIGNNMFGPSMNVTREAFLRMILGAANIELSDAETPFEDVDENGWYAKYVATAYNLGIVSGISENSFGIGQNIKRQDMAVMTENLLKILAVTAEEADTSYTDADSIAEYAKTSVNVLAALSVMNGDENNRFSPNANATRAEASRIVYAVSLLID